MVGIDRSFVRPLGRLAMGVELEAGHIVGELLSIRMEVQADPADVVLGRVGMGDLLAQGDFDFKELVGSYLLYARKDMRSAV